MRNIEIKAVVTNLKKLLERTKALSNSEPTTILQDDTFYPVPKGRFKLREFEHGNGELIFYDRPDLEGPKLSSYQKFDIPTGSVAALSSVLNMALGVCGKVKKERLLFLIGQTRVHIDKVDGLGDFVELEVVLAEEETTEYGEKIAEDLMEKLGIDKSDLLSCAYTDLLQKKL